LNGSKRDRFFLKVIEKTARGVRIPVEVGH